MPTEPEREIEKQLRAYAKERREQASAPLELHPATRKLLQGEAARLKGKGAGASTFWSRLPGIWPRLAFGASIAAALMLACWLMLPVSSRPKPESKLAENLERFREAEINQPAPATPPRLLAETPAPVKSEVDSLKAPVTNLLAYDDGRRGVGGLAGGELARSKDIADKKSKTELELQDGFAPGKPALAPAQNSVARDDLAKNLNQKEVLPTATAPATAAPTLDDRAGGVPNLAVSEPRPAASVTSESVNEAFRKRYGRFLGNGAVSAGSSNANAREEKLALQESVGRFSPAPAVITGQQAFTYGINPGAKEATQQLFAKTDSISAGRRYLSSQGANPVLNSFRVEQNGNEVRVIDGDGSVYAGQFQIAAVPAAAGAFDAPAAPVTDKQTPVAADVGIKTVARAADAENKPAQDYFFRVTGTNRSINQSVVFSGRFLARTNGNLRLPLGAITGLAAGTNAPAGPPAVSLSNLRIEGQAIIGGTNQVQIIATPTGP